MADMAAQVCHPLPGVRWLCCLCWGAIHCYLLHSEVVHFVPAVFRDHTHLCTCCGGKHKDFIALDKYS